MYFFIQCLLYSFKCIFYSILHCTYTIQVEEQYTLQQSSILYSRAVYYIGRRVVYYIVEQYIIQVEEQYTIQVEEQYTIQVEEQYTIQQSSILYSRAVYYIGRRVVYYRVEQYTISRCDSTERYSGAGLQTTVSQEIYNHGRGRRIQVSLNI